MTKEQAKALGEIVAKINKLREELDSDLLSDRADITIEGAMTDASDYLSLAATSINELLRD